MTDQMTEAATTTEGDASTGALGTDTAAAAQAAGDAAAASEASTQQQAATGDANQSGTVSGEEGKAKGDEGKPQGAPEAYELNLPEGVQLDEKGMGAYTDLAKELNLTQEAAQKVLDKMGPVIAGRHTEALTQARTQWFESTKADPEFGGEKLQENLGVARKALDQFGTPELSKLLNESGLGNHPEIIRAFYRAGKAISEDGFVAGGRSTAASNEPAKRLFPNQA